MATTETAELTNSDWHLTLREGGRAQVHAAYHRLDTTGSFVEFKNADHKLVFTVAASEVITIQRIEES